MITCLLSFVVILDSIKGFHLPLTCILSFYIHKPNDTELYYLSKRLCKPSEIVTTLEANKRFTIQDTVPDRMGPSRKAMRQY